MPLRKKIKEIITENNQENQITEEPPPQKKITYLEVDDDIELMENDLLSFRKEISNMIQKMRDLRKKYRRCVKLNVKKKIGPTNNNYSENLNDNVNSKVMISSELSEFIKKPENEEISCGEVSHSIMMYVKNNNLQDTKNPLNIKPDLKLKKLLKIGNKDKLTFHNLQTYLKTHHYL